MRKMKDSGVPWIGDIPEGWEVIKNKYLSKMQSGNTIKSENLMENGEFPVYGGNGLRGFLNRYTNDGTYILIGRQGALCGNVRLVKGKFWASEHAIVIYDNNKLIYKKYYFYFLESSNLNQYSASAAQPGLAVEVIENLRTCLPSLQTQQHIADFLDTKCTQIDDIITKEKGIIEKLKEYRQSVITEAVTKGLNPSATMKDSGIDWIGEIPEHWEVRKLKNISKLKTGTTPAGNKGINNSEGYNWFTPSDFLTQNLFKSSKLIHKDVVKEENIHMYPTGSTLLVGIGATVGKVGIIQKISYSNQQITAIMPFAIQCQYLFYSVLSCAKFIKDNALYTTLQIISNGYLKEMQFSLPPLEEQKAIAAYLDKKTDLIDNAISQKEQLIEKLKQYKKSLIYEAVTGKMEV